MLVENKKEDKIVMQRPYYPGGIDKSIVDFDQMHTVKPAITFVTHAMYKRNGITYLGLKQSVAPKEKIQIGMFPSTYSIVGQARGKLIKDGYLYRVKRTDGFNIVQLDLDNAVVGAKVKIKNRRTFRQLINYEQLFDNKE